MFESYRCANVSFKDQRYRNQVAEVELILMDNDVEYVLWLPWHLCASCCEGGLGSAASDVTEFGVGWGLRMLQVK